MKTMDKNKNSNQRKEPNLTGWGNNLFALTEAQISQAIQIKIQTGESYNTLGKRFGVAGSTMWRSIQKKVPTFKGKIKRVGEYDDAFRVAACQYYLKHGVRFASYTFGCSEGSIYNWLKTYDLTTAAFNN